MRPDQLNRYRTLSDPQLHPDGVSIAFVVATADFEANCYHSRIWRWDGSAAEPVTAGPHDSAPRWAPNGDTLAFLTAEGCDDDPQLAVLRPGDAQPTILTDFALGAEQPAWSPTGDEIGVVGATWVDESLDDDERKDQVRRITRVPYRADDRGWIHDRRSHIYVVPVFGGEVRCITPGDFDEGDFTWTPDGRGITFVSARHDDRGLDPGSRLFTVTTDGGEVVPVTDVGLWEKPRYDTAGRLHAIGSTDRWAYPGVMPLLRIEPGTPPLVVTPHLDRDLVTMSPRLAPGGPQWLDDGTAVSTLEDSGAVTLVRLDTDGGTTTVVGGERAVTGFSARSDGSALAFVATSPTDPGELWWWQDGTERQLTDLNGSFRDEVDLVAPQRFVIEHEGIEVEGWIYAPAGDSTVPVLFNIHGGPATQYGYYFFDEFQVYAAAGYGVVATNPRGSSGYGHKHVRAVIGSWADDTPPDVRDLEAAVDAAADVEPRLDTSRVGVMGGSYGGFMTAWLTARSGRYSSAIAERGVYSWLSFHGTSDISPWFARLYLGEDATGPKDDAWLAKMWAASPLSMVDAIRTPTMVIHSESDHRAPMEQAEQFFQALLTIGVDTELVRFPEGASHELSRSGAPRLRQQRFELILEWHDRYLNRGR